MKSRAGRFFLRLLSYIIPDCLSRWLAKLWSRTLRTELGGQITDDFLELLLKGLDLAFCLSTRFRRNLKGFGGLYVFETADGSVAASALFQGGDMTVSEEAIDNPDVRIRFKHVPALWAFIQQNQDVLNSILADEVEIREHALH